MTPALKDILTHYGKDAVVQQYDYLYVLDSFLSSAKTFSPTSFTHAKKFVHENFKLYQKAILNLGAKSSMVANTRAVSVLVYSQVSTAPLAFRVENLGLKEVGAVCLLSVDTIEYFKYSLSAASGATRKFEMLQYVEI